MALVLSGGEVTPQGLAERVRAAAALVFALDGAQLQGVSALKHPLPAYRRSIQDACGFPISEADYPFELGWLFVRPAHRGRDLSRVLAQAALDASQGAGIFATSRTDNLPMHRTNAKVGFSAVGAPYPSSRGAYTLQLFVRPALATVSPPLCAAETLKTDA